LRSALVVVPLVELSLAVLDETLDDALGVLEDFAPAADEAALALGFGVEGAEADAEAEALGDADDIGDIEADALGIGVDEALMDALGDTDAPACEVWLEVVELLLP